tara:strand:+ start:325 stop:1035 length:711 start_codon:yes stop_codon:yes gene_type:complete
MIPLFFMLACVQYHTEDFLVGEIGLSYLVVAEDLEEATVYVRLLLDRSPYPRDMTLSEDDSLYIEHDGDSYILDEEDSSMLVIADVLYTKKIPYSDITKPFTLVFDRPSGQYKTDLYLANDFSISVHNDEPFAFNSSEYMPVDIRWTPIVDASSVRAGLRDTDCAYYSDGLVENTGQTQIEIELYEPVVHIGLMDLFCTVNVYVSAHTVGYTTDFAESDIRGSQRRSSYIKVLYMP